MMLKQESYHYLDEDWPHHQTEKKGELTAWIYPEGMPQMEEDRNWLEWEFYPTFYAFVSVNKKVQSCIQSQVSPHPFLNLTFYYGQGEIIW